MATVTVLPSYDYPTPYFCTTLQFPDQLKINPYDAIFYNGSTSELIYVERKEDGNIYTGTKFPELSEEYKNKIITQLLIATEYNRIVIRKTDQPVQILHLSGAHDTAVGSVIWYNVCAFDALPNLNFPKEMAIVIINEGFVFQCTKNDGTDTAVKLMSLSTAISKPGQNKDHYYTRIGIDMFIALSDLSGKVNEITFDVGTEYKKIIRPVLVAMSSYEKRQVDALTDIYNVVKKGALASNKCVYLSEVRQKGLQNSPEGAVICPTYTWIESAKIEIDLPSATRTLRVKYTERLINDKPKTFTQFMVDAGLKTHEVVFVKEN